MADRDKDVPRLITRRNFLKAGAALVGAVGAGAMAKLIPNMDITSTAILEGGTTLGVYDKKIVGSIDSLTQFSQNLFNPEMIMSGINHAQIAIGCGGVDGGLCRFESWGTKENEVILGSLYKPIVTTLALERGINLSQSEIDQIVHDSGNAPGVGLARRIFPSITSDELAVRQALIESNVNPTNPIGELPLKADMSDLFTWYVSKYPLDSRIKQSMEVGHLDRAWNYGVGYAMGYNLNSNIKTMMKIGLLPTADNKSHVTSFQMIWEQPDSEDHLFLFGTAQGTKLHTRSLMLWVAALGRELSSHISQNGWNIPLSQEKDHQGILQFKKKFPT